MRLGHLTSDELRFMKRVKAQLKAADRQGACGPHTFGLTTGGYLALIHDGPKDGGTAFRIAAALGFRVTCELNKIPATELP